MCSSDLDLAAASAAIDAGADLIDLWTASDETAQQVAARHPDLPICARIPGAALAKTALAKTAQAKTAQAKAAQAKAAQAKTARALLICPNIAEAEQAESRGLPRSELLVETPPDQAPGLIKAGWQVIVDADHTPGPHAAAAAAAIATWLGAVAVRTSHVTAVRQAVDMTATIRGTRPIPAGYVRS